MIGTYAKLAGVLALVAAIFLGGYKIADWRGKAALASLQHGWDEDKASIQAVTDKAIAQATKERDEAIQTNQVLHDQYEANRANAAADTAAFAKRLRDAESRLTAANSRPVPIDSAGQGDVSSGEQGSAQQLGQLVTLVAELRGECKANDDTLDSLYASLNSQPHVLQ